MAVTQTSSRDTASLGRAPGGPSVHGSVSFARACRFTPPHPHPQVPPPTHTHTHGHERVKTEGRDVSPGSGRG